MDLNQIITLVMLAFFVLGAIDYVLEGRLGLRAEFESGLMAAGRLTLCMAGFIVLAPLIAQALGPVVTPVFRALGIDPSVLAGMILANDCGGSVLAMELADTPEAGLFSGLIVGSMLGTTIMLNIPTLMSFATEDERPSVIYGLLCGIIAIPLGCLAGGFAAGFSAQVVVMNTLPVLALSVLLLILLFALGQKIVPAFSVFGKLLVGVSIFGLICGTIESLTGYAVFEGMDTLDSVFPVVGGISLYLAGAFTLMAVVRRVFAKGMGAIGKALRVNDTSVSALLLALANPVPPMMMMHEMDTKGRMLNVAFLVPIGCVLGDHLAYTAQVAPEMCIPVMIGKLVAGFTAFAAALFLYPKLMKQESKTKITECDPMKASSLTRWLYLALGTAAMLFAGILYGWSILKAPFSAEFGWSASQLALNFTITMCFFCIGGVAGGVLSKKAGSNVVLTLAALLAGTGFLLTARLTGQNVTALYATYGVLAALGIGMAYNVILSCVSAWFPDKKGLCSGLLMMGFGSSALVLGQICDYMIQSPGLGWRFAFSMLGLSLGLLFLLCALILRAPANAAAASQSAADSNDCSPREMTRGLTFWRAFLCVAFLCAVGNSTISFAKDLAMSVGAAAGLATTLVGALSVCNGLGRILTGALFDTLGCRKTMLIANLLAIAAALTALCAVLFSSIPLCVAGLCLIGLSYGTCPTISSAFISDFYGRKHFSVNFSIMGFNMMVASFIASGANALVASSGGYAAPFVLLLLLAGLALVLNVRIFQRKG